MEPHSQRQVNGQRQHVRLLRATKRFVTWGADILAAALVASACAGGGNGTAQPTSTRSLQEEGPARPGNLLAPNRTHLSLCVDAAGGGTVTSNELDLVSAALDNALASLTGYRRSSASRRLRRAVPRPSR